jgi:hypothetical protein
VCHPGASKRLLEGLYTILFKLQYSGIHLRTDITILKNKVEIRQKRDLQSFRLEHFATVPAFEHPGILGRTLHIEIKRFTFVLHFDDTVAFLAFWTGFSTYKGHSVHHFVSRVNNKHVFHRRVHSTQTRGDQPG